MRTSLLLCCVYKALLNAAILVLAFTRFLVWGLDEELYLVVESILYRAWVCMLPGFLGVARYIPLLYRRFSPIVRRHVYEPRSPCRCRVSDRPLFVCERLSWLNHLYLMHLERAAFIIFVIYDIVAFVGHIKRDTDCRGVFFARSLRSCYSRWQNKA